MFTNSHIPWFKSAFAKNHILDSFTGDDIGVVVNGVVTHVYDNEFEANHVPLLPGDNSTITAWAFNDAGDNASDSVTVIADTGGNYITLSSNPESGIVSAASPLDFTLSLARTYDNGTYSFSYEPDNGSIENRGDNETTMKFERRVAQPGLYYITVEDNETLDNGTKVLHTDTIAIMADNRTALDTKLKGKWEGMRSALVGGNVDGAVVYFSSDRRVAYSEVLQAIPVDKIDIAIPATTSIEFVDVEDFTARYVTDIDIIENSVPMTVSSYVIFVKGTNGLWKINFF